MPAGEGCRFSDRLCPTASVGVAARGWFWRLAFNGASALPGRGNTVRRSYDSGTVRTSMGPVTYDWDGNRTGPDWALVGCRVDGLKK